ncbi:hypothetical protein ACH4NF_34590 [Streptomyces sp. NPDC017248]|uniref:hypothetical protein n=1 Tax=unclassified Streptomyces TaxID=2593676 RepID=UPI00341A3E14
MKKRSMLALATLAAGFVVAAVTPSHAADGGALGDLDVPDTVQTAGHLVSQGSLSVDESPLGQD